MRQGLAGGLSCGGWRLARRNGGQPGVDGESFRDIEALSAGSPVRWRGMRQPTAREGQVRPAGWRRGLKYRGCRVMPAEGSDWHGRNRGRHENGVVKNCPSAVDHQYPQGRHEQTGQLPLDFERLNSLVPMKRTMLATKHRIRR